MIEERLIESSLKLRDYSCYLNYFELNAIFSDYAKIKLHMILISYVFGLDFDLPEITSDMYKYQSCQDMDYIDELYEDNISFLEEYTTTLLKSLDKWGWEYELQYVGDIGDSKNILSIFDANYESMTVVLSNKKIGQFLSSNIDDTEKCAFVYNCLSQSDCNSNMCFGFTSYCDNLPTQPLPINSWNGGAFCLSDGVLYYAVGFDSNDGWSSVFYDLDIGTFFIAKAIDEYISSFA